MNDFKEENPDRVVIGSTKILRVLHDVAGNYLVHVDHSPRRLPKSPEASAKRNVEFLPMASRCVGDCPVVQRRARLRLLCQRMSHAISPEPLCFAKRALAKCDATFNRFMRTDSDPRARAV